ncbi:hypothetical protein CCACVL1_10925 [Corchorus capsularis]|uniref:Uncharacterized protein n=1 Tax=Corchorus capsularis TaxID=210143 RepID=A0A1R3INZ9_COCAP|nr:hypothetical protein CCACVL1_10925 [Corchorus capsularis]
MATDVCEEKPIKQRLPIIGP